MRTAASSYGRAREIIKAGGNRVSAKEIEEHIVAMTEVVEVAVIGVPDEILGEAIKAFIVVRDDSLTDHTCAPIFSATWRRFSSPNSSNSPPRFRRTKLGRSSRRSCAKELRRVRALFSSASSLTHRMSANQLTRDSLRLDCALKVEEAAGVIRKTLTAFRRRGLIVALSGGIDSSVTAALCVRAVGAARVLGIHMPEKDSSSDTLQLSQSVSSHFGFDSVVEDITPLLEAVGCYRRQEQSIRLAIPEYGPDWKSKIVLESVLDNPGFNYFHVVAQSPEGRILKQRLSSQAYLGIVAATNFKQRVRKMMEYYHADRLNYAVTGTPNRLEYDQGFFVKLGDGAADIKPIAHLYKSQVYELAEFLGVPDLGAPTAAHNRYL